MNDSTLKDVLLNPTTSGSGSHYISDCPFCQKKGHLYVQRATSKKNQRGENVSFFFHCKKCNEKGKLYKLLKALGRLDLIQFKPSIRTVLQPIALPDSFDENVLQVQEQPLPANFNRIYQSNYLEGRGFTRQQFDKYVVGEIDSIVYSNYIVFPVIEEGLCKGFVARSTLNNLKQLNEGRSFKILRYKNSVNTDFSKLLYGIDEITEKTDTVILVEGVFDKFNVDRELFLDSSERIKCVACFGKKISDIQITKLKNKGVQKVFLFFDEDAKKDSIAFGFKLQLVFSSFKTRIVDCSLVSKKDAGEMTGEQLLFCLKNSYTAFSFHNKLLNFISNEE